MYVSYAEYLRLPEFRMVCNRVRQRSGGLCEWCGIRKATEPHHVAYCEWGQVDDELNLLDVCHQCHCNLHRCQRCLDVKLKAKDIKLGKRICVECNRSK